MGRLLKAPKKSLPQCLPFSLKEFQDRQHYWNIWQAVGRKPTEFLAAMKIPSDLWSFFMQADDLLDTMIRMKQEQEAPQNG